MRHLHPHTGDTPESFRPHTNFGMAVGSMQTWNLSWLFTDIEYFFTHYYPWSVRDHPNTILPRGLQHPCGSLTLRHWRYSGGSPRPLLQSRDNSCIIAKKKSTLWAFIKQSELCFCELLSELLLLLLLLRSLCKWFQKENADLNKHPVTLLRSFRLQQLTGRQ